MSLVVLATEWERVVRQIKGRALVTTYGFAEYYLEFQIVGTLFNHDLIPYVPRNVV